jgi:hypothetical protein
VLQVVGQQLPKYSHLVFIHCFKKELFVVREEEERAWLASWLFGFEDLKPVQLGVQTLLYHALSDAVHFADCREDGGRVLLTKHFFVDGHCFLGVLVWVSQQKRLSIHHIRLFDKVFFFRKKVCSFGFVPFVDVLYLNLVQRQSSDHLLLSFYLRLEFWLVRLKVEVLDFVIVLNRKYVLGAFAVECGDWLE